eukprot:907899-Rhodomonas_salina.8
MAREKNEETLGFRVHFGWRFRSGFGVRSADRPEEGIGPRKRRPRPLSRSRCCTWRPHCTPRKQFVSASELGTCEGSRSEGG